MLTEFTISKEILDEVLDQKTPFADALKKRFVADKDIRPLRSKVAGLVGCALRHVIYFNYMMKGLPELDDNQKRHLLLVLSDLYFYRRFDKEELLKGLTEVLGEEKLQLAMPLIDLAEDPTKYIPESVDRRTALYLSLRFNTPEWCVKIISHFGGAATYQTLRKFARPQAMYLRARTSVLGLTELFENPEFTSTPIDGLVLYNGKNPLRKNNDFAAGRLFPERPLTRDLIIKHPVQDPGQILLLNTNADTSIEKDLIEHYGDKVGLNIGVSDIDHRADTTRLIREKKLKNVNYFAPSDFSFLDAHVASMQKLVIVAPDSTNFDLAPTSPDYLLNFDTGKMDDIIAKERMLLESGGKYVDEGGTLLYVVYTVSKKEGHGAVAEFLKIHPEFKLVEERQYFPYEELETAAYVAELTKGEKELVLPPAFNDLTSISQKPGVSAQAQSK